MYFCSGYSRNTKTQITQSKTLVDNEARREPRQEDKKTTENPTRDIDQQQLKYVEKVMVSVHRGAGEVERLVQDSAETSSVVESSDLYSCPAPKPLEHVRQSSRNVDRNRYTNVVPTRGAAGQQASITHSSAKTGFGSGPTSDKSSSPVSKSWQHVCSGSGEDDAKIVVTRDVPAKRLPPLNPEKNYAATKQDKTQVAGMNEDWGHVIEELVIKNTAETTNALNNETNAVDDRGRTQLSQEQVSLGTTQVHPKDSPTPIQYSRNSLVSNSGGTSQTWIRNSSKSLEVVDRTDGNKSLDVQGINTVCQILYVKKCLSCDDIPHHTIPYHTIPYHTVPYHTIPYHAIPYHTMPCHTIPCHTIPYHAMPYHTIPYHTIPYHTIPYHTIPYHTIPYHTTPYHTIPYHIISCFAFHVSLFCLHFILFRCRNKDIWYITK